MNYLARNTNKHSSVPMDHSYHFFHVWSIKFFSLVCIFQFFWKFVHHKIRVFISKMEKFKLKIYIWSWGVCFFFFLLLALLFINYRLGHFSFCHPFLIHFRKQIRFEFIISLFKIWNKPINDVLKSYIFNYGFKWLSTKFNGTLWAFVSGRIF